MRLIGENTAATADLGSGVMVWCCAAVERIRLMTVKARLWQSRPDYGLNVIHLQAEVFKTFKTKFSSSKTSKLSKCVL